MLSGRGAIERFRLDVGEGQKFVDAAHGVSRDDPGKDVGQIGGGIDVVELAGGDERGDDCPVLAAAVGPCEQVVLSAQSDRPDGALDDVVVELDAAIVEEAAEALPARQRVADRLGDLGLARYQAKLTLEPGLERLEDRLAAQLAHAASLLRRLVAARRLDGIERSNTGECLAGDRRGRAGGLQVVEIPSHVRPAKCQLHRTSRRQLAVIRSSETPLWCCATSSRRSCRLQPRCAITVSSWIPPDQRWTKLRRRLQEPPDDDAYPGVRALDRCGGGSRHTCVG